MADRYNMPDFEMPAMLSPGRLSERIGGMERDTPRRSMSPGEALVAGIERKHGKYPTSPATGATATPATPAAPQQAPAAIKPAAYSSGPYYSGDPERDQAKWREDAGRRVDERTAAIANRTFKSEYAPGSVGYSRDLEKFGVPTEVARHYSPFNVDIKPASGAYNYNEDMRGRAQNEYWANQKDIADARYALNNYTDLSPADRARYAATISEGKKSADARYAIDTSADTSRYGHDAQRYGHDIHKYGYDQQRGGIQDQMRGAIDKARVEQEDPARVGMGEYYKGAGANQAAQARSAAFMQGLNERAAGGDQNAMRMLSVFNKQDQSGHLAAAAGKVIESHMGTEQELMSKLKMLTSLFQQPGGATGGTSGVRFTREQVSKHLGRPATDAEVAEANGEKLAEGGVVGYAGGGAIQEPTQDPMQRVHPLVGEYRRYSMIAQQMGATPVSFEDFGALRQAAAQRQTQPQDYSEGGVVGYAEGGGVGAWMREKFMPKTTAAIRGDRIEQELNRQTGQANQQPAQPPQREVHSSDPETEALLRKYKGFAEGGAISVGGRQVLGPGDGKSDSIPAVIDGRKPAALSTGEFVMPVEAVQHFGLDRLNKMVESARKSRQEV